MEIEEKLINSRLDNVQGTDAGKRPMPMRTPNNPPWNVLEAFAVWIASVLFILIVPTIILLAYLIYIQVPITDGERVSEVVRSDPAAVFLQIIAIIPAHMLTLLLAWLVVTRVRKYPFRKTLGWEKGGFAWWHYAMVLGFFFVIAAVVGAFFPEQENDLLRILRSSRAAVFIVAFVATFTAPLVEEVVYRGVLYSAFQSKFGVPAAFILVTVLFALVHVPQYYPSYSTIFLLTLLSVTLTAVRVVSKNLLPCIILHTVFNGFQSSLLILEPYINTYKPIEPVASIIYNLAK